MGRGGVQFDQTFSWERRRRGAEGQAEPAEAGWGGGLAVVGRKAGVCENLEVNKSWQRIA